MLSILAAARLADIESKEKLAQEVLKSAQSSLNQIAFIIRSNDFLTRIAAQETGCYQANLQEVLDELAQRQHGNVEKKSRKTEALVAKIETSANQWLDQLNQQTQTTRQQLSTALAQLDAIATLDEPALTEARRLLDSASALGGYGAKSRFHLDELLPEFKRRSDHGQACAAAARALQDVAGPVIDTYEEAALNRQQARELLA